MNNADHIIVDDYAQYLISVRHDLRRLEVCLSDKNLFEARLIIADIKDNLDGIKRNIGD